MIPTTVRRENLIKIVMSAAVDAGLSIEQYERLVAVACEAEAVRVGGFGKKIPDHKYEPGTEPVGCPITQAGLFRIGVMKGATGRFIKNFDQAMGHDGHNGLAEFGGTVVEVV